MEQTTPLGAQRVFAPANAKIDIDRTDDMRVDVDVAVLDYGVKLDHPDINIVAGADCLAATSSDYSCSSDPGDGDEPNSAHGTMIAEIIGAIDNSIGRKEGWGVGVAPGARIWALSVGDPAQIGQAVATAMQQYKEGKPWVAPQMEIEPLIAGVKWVTEHADQIEVLHMAAYCTTDTAPALPEPVCADPDQIDELQEALEEAIEEGLVVLAPAGNTHKLVDSNAEEPIGKIPGVITVSAIFDGDGLPEGLDKTLGKPCNELFGQTEADDTNADSSAYGPGIDVAAPGPCTSRATPHASGAAAILASMDNPENKADVEVIGQAIYGDRDCAGGGVGAGDCRWTDESDAIKEPVVSVANETIFAPQAAAVDSDVNGDRRADLVSLRAGGVVYVHQGGTDAKFGSGKASFSGKPLNVAQYDGTGHYLVDVTDVNGDRRSDLVTLTDDGDLHTYAGKGDASFDETGTTSALNLTPGLLDAGGHEPIAVADVNGDSRGDLIAYDDVADAVKVYPGEADGSFSAAITARTGVSSALHTGIGHYFVDAADVTGDNRADLVSMHEEDLNVFAGQIDGTFAAPEVSHENAVPVAMDDGSGFEPAGLADTTGDRKADLTLLKDGNLHLYPGEVDGDFGTKVQTGAGLGTSTTLNAANAFEFLGALDVKGDGRADLAGIATSDRKVVTIQGEANGSFAASQVKGSEAFPSTQHKAQTSTNNEPALEKPSWRRRGCDAKGCGWVVKEAPNATAAKDNRVTAISCTSASFCLATAYQTYLGTTWAYGIAWNGSSWTNNTGGAPYQENSGVMLTGVSCTSSTSCTAVGREVEGSETLNIAVRWDGSKWNRLGTVPNAEASKDNRLTAISCTSASFCLTTGHVNVFGVNYAYGRTWDGSTWTSIAGGAPYQQNGGVELSDVSCISPTSCTAVGKKVSGGSDQALIAHWGGGLWTRQQAQSPAGATQTRLTGVSCTFPTCQVAGSYATAEGVFNLAEHSP